MLCNQASNCCTSRNYVIHLQNRIDVSLSSMDDSRDGCDLNDLGRRPDGRALFFRLVAAARGSLAERV